MNKEIIEQAKNLLAAHSCCQEAKDAANAWLCAVGTADEKEKAKALVAELEEDIMPIDGLIGFAASDMGAKVFGEERRRKCWRMRKPSRLRARSIATARPAWRAKRF